MKFGVSHVYFIQEMGPERRIKIGFSAQGEFRISAVRTWCPYDATLVASLPGDRLLERCLHQRFAKDRMNGEWFMPSREMMLAIDEIRNTGTLKETAFLRESFGSGLVAFRAKQKLSQRELARTIGSTQSAISLAERSFSPSSTIACRLYELSNSRLASSALKSARSNA